MRALLERSRGARSAVAALSALVVVALAHAATAGDDLGIRRATLFPEQVVPEQAVASSPAETQTPPATLQIHRNPRRIWAASRSRPLRIALGRAQRCSRLAAAGRRVRTAGLRAPAEPQVVFPKLIILPKPDRPALVSIYQDRTLRSGDAVMMADGIHIFHGAPAWPYRPRDFVRLTLAAVVDWHLRQTLNDLDKNPPTRWSSAGGVAG